MGWPKRLKLIRHAESEGNVLSSAERALYDMGSQNYPLTPRGRHQAEITGQYLRDNFPPSDIRYVSYYVRSKQSMELMRPGEKTYEDPRLAEAQRGIWHTMTHEQVAQRFPEEITRKAREGLYHYRPLGGENWPDIELRIHSFMGTLSRDYEDQEVEIVGHGHWIILFDRLTQRFTIDEAMARYKSATIENASVTIYEGTTINGKSRLVLKETNIVPWKGKI